MNVVMNDGMKVYMNFANVTFVSDNDKVGGQM